MTEDQVSDIVQHAEHEIAEQIGATLDRFDAALEALHSDLENHAQALEHGLQALETALSPDADDMKQAHENLALLLQRMALTDADEHGEGSSGDDPSAAMAGASVAAAAAAAAKMHEAVETETHAIQTLHDPVAAEFAAGKEGLEGLRDTIGTSIKAVEDNVSAQLQVASTHMQALGAEITGLGARGEALLQSVHDHHNQAGDAIEQALAQAGAHVVEGVQQAAGRTGEKFAGSLVEELRGASGQIEAALRQLDDKASTVTSVFEGDIGRVVGQVEQVASLLQQIKPLLDAAEALL